MRYLLTTIALLTTLAVWGQSVSDSKRELGKLSRVYELIDKLYVDKVDMSPLVEEATRAMLEELDPHSRYLSREELAKEKERFSGGYSGIGVQNQIVDDTLRIVSIMDSSPAKEAGLRVGDRVVRIDSVIAVKPTTETSHLIRGAEGSVVELEVVRPHQAQRLTFNITRQRIPHHSIDVGYMVDDSTLYVKINQFITTTSSEFLALLLEHKSAKRLIIDLCGNGGGLLYQAQAVASVLLDKGATIVSTQGRAIPKRTLTAVRGHKFKGEVVILVDQNTASASEIVAGAVQDWDRGIIIGRQTFGKGLVQRQIELNDSSAIRLTIAHYNTPSGRVIQRPYERGNREQYQKAHIDRLKGGNTQQESDSLPKYYTLNNKRVVYGGGGITPDLFVEVDTSTVTPYFRAIVRKEIIPIFANRMVDNQREAILEHYPDFESFKHRFTLSDDFMDKFYDYASQHDVPYNKQEAKSSEELIRRRLMVYLATTLYGSKYLYMMDNHLGGNLALNKALEVLSSRDRYNQILGIKD